MGDFVSDEWEVVFGLSIDEEITWGAIEVNITPRIPRIEDYNLDTFINGRILAASAPTPKDDIHNFLKQKLILIRARTGNLFERVRSISVSTIGLVDNENKRLVSIQRKSFVPEHSDYTLDFVNLFANFFPSDVPICVHNDATSICMAHYPFDDRIHKHSTDKHNHSHVLCYVHVSEGINIGLVQRGTPLLTSNLHPQIGHTYPRLHGIDVGKNLLTIKAITGCSCHGRCFEGLASAARIRNEWKTTSLSDAAKINEAAPHVIAFYVAQLCWNACLAAAPDKILIGGGVCSPDIFHEICDNFDDLNKGIGEHPYIRPEALGGATSEFIRPTKPLPFPAIPGTVGPIDGLIGAFELARRQLRFK